jgi:hypothetical protein
MFFVTQNASINSPRFTSDSPQLHHKKPHTKHPFSRKPPAKTPLHHAKKNNPQKSTTNPITIAE